MPHSSLAMHGLKEKESESIVIISEDITTSSILLCVCFYGVHSHVLVSNLKMKALNTQVSKNVPNAFSNVPISSSFIFFVFPNLHSWYQ